MSGDDACDAVPDVDERFAAAARASRSSLWRDRVTPGERLARLATACDELGVDEWDVYGEGGPVAMLEGQVAELLGKPAAVLFPSGIMAQQATLRVWCERMGSMRVAIPDLAHQLSHEGDGPRLLQGFRFEWLTQGRRVATAADLRALPEGLGAVQVELPLRDAGCLLPSWEELTDLSAAARDLGVPLHVDGARLWESQPFWDRPLPEIAALADSVYVSFYKGLGGLAGAVVVADTDVVDEIRLWRTRMGGTLFHLTPYAVSGLVGLRDELPRLGECVAWARELAAGLVRYGFDVHPDPPHTNTFEVYARVGRDVLIERGIRLIEREHVQMNPGWRDSDVPGVSTAELAIHTVALAHDPARVAGWYAELLG
ncbi:beta-eliminating lyase-related protein [Lapillicoccus sp.]|uniref:threonine aldolase family protein n=1 Tax=Lapillicoccus sp. TaxID=1909287 RepID=UPI0025D152D6|nr:beta-eliminating lyase-related protein [Lapillicoccus sp.]